MRLHASARVLAGVGGGGAPACLRHEGDEQDKQDPRRKGYAWVPWTTTARVSP